MDQWNGVNIEIPDNRNISAIRTRIHRQMESSHGSSEMSFKGFSCWSCDVFVTARVPQFYVDTVMDFRIYEKCSYTIPLLVLSQH